MNRIHVIVCTKHRYVAFGSIDPDDQAEPSIKVQGSRCAIRFGTRGGVAELAETGPTPSSRIGARADVLLHDVTAVFQVTDAAAAAWEAAPTWTA